MKMVCQVCPTELWKRADQRGLPVSRNWQKYYLWRQEEQRGRVPADKQWSKRKWWESDWNDRLRLKEQQKDLKSTYLILIPGYYKLSNFCLGMVSFLEECLGSCRSLAQDGVAWEDAAKPGRLGIWLRDKGRHSFLELCNAKIQLLYQVKQSESLLACWHVFDLFSWWSPEIDSQLFMNGFESEQCVNWVGSIQTDYRLSQNPLQEVSAFNSQPLFFATKHRKCLISFAFS